MNPNDNNFVAILGNGAWYEFNAKNPDEAIRDLSGRFSDTSWGLYEIDPIDGKVRTERIASSGYVPNVPALRLAEMAEVF